MVPYEKNEQFVGRQELVKDLRGLLCDVTPMQYNHRAALFGMGGVGKTQTSIAYVYAYRASYQRIYWISAATELSFFAGVQEIAARSGCVPAGEVQNMGGAEVSKRVLAWLNQQDNWLFVIDNLEKVEMIVGFLPDRAPNKHTLITTRNPDTSGIPARGLEVPLLNLDEGVEVLYALSGMDSTIERDDALTVLKELGYLPLAIEQAASYVRQVT